MNIGKSLKIALIHKDMSLRDLSGRVGVTSAYLSAVSNNTKNISFDRLRVVCGELDMKVSEFIKLGETEEIK